MAMQRTTNSPSSSTVVNVARQIVSLTLNNRRLAALPISYDLTLDELRIQLRQRFISIEPDDQFLYRGFLIAPTDEIKFHIYQVVENDVVAMQSRSKTLASPDRELSSYFCELRSMTTATCTTSDNPDAIDSTNYYLDRNKWRLVYDHTSLLRGRCFLNNGPQISDYPVIRLKSNWRPNSFPFDDARLHVEMCHQQTNNEYINGKLYNMNAIINLPFVNIIFRGSRHTSQSLITNVENTSTYYYHKLPRVVHIFDETMIEAEPIFMHEIDRVLDQSQNENTYTKLCSVFNKYGHGYAAKVVLGGYQVRVQHQHMDETYDKDELDQQIKLSVKVNPNEMGAGVASERNRKQAKTRQETNNNLLIDRSTTGGDVLKSDVNEWCEALKDPNTWRIIEYQRIEPVYKLLDLERQQKIENILFIHAEQEKQLKCRCRIVPEQLLFNSEEGIYKYDSQLKHNKQTNSRSLSLKMNDTFLFFYSPLYDQWFWKSEGDENSPWKFLKYTIIDQLKMKSIHDIMHVLQQTNPIPTHDIIAISQKFETVYVPNGTVAQLCKAVNHLFKTHRFP